MGDSEEADIVEELLNAADDLPTLSRAQLAELLRAAALEISALRKQREAEEPPIGRDTAA